MKRVLKKHILEVLLLSFVLLLLSYVVIQELRCHYAILYLPEDLMEVINNNSIKEVIIDLREQEDYELSHIADSINIPYRDATEIDLYLSKNNAKNKVIYLICYSGNRAAKAFNYLTEKGYKNIIYISFGYDDFLDWGDGVFQPESGPCKCLSD